MAAVEMVAATTRRAAPRRPRVPPPHRAPSPCPTTATASADRAKARAIVANPWSTPTAARTAIGARAVGAAWSEYLIKQAGDTKGNPLYIYTGAATDNNAFVALDHQLKVRIEHNDDGSVSGELVMVVPSQNLSGGDIVPAHMQSMSLASR